MDPADLGPDPLAAFAAWYEDAVRSGARLPDAVALATATPDGRPSVRMVLYKGVEAGGLVFYSNYESRKARELALNPRAALVFHWAGLSRQVRVEGSVERLSERTSDDYFRTRARDSQLGAWASPQSRPIENRRVLEERLHALDRQHTGNVVPRPKFWGGYRLLPELIEFWCEREHRLHDRIVYERTGAGWRTSRLAP
jgi:pyridoxamine 5'-phosphate oxidase